MTEYSHTNQKPGWKCTRGPHEDGPCALVPDMVNAGRWQVRYDVDGAILDLVLDAAGNPVEGAWIVRPERMAKYEAAERDVKYLRVYLRRVLDELKVRLSKEGVFQEDIERMSIVVETEALLRG